MKANEEQGKRKEERGMSAPLPFNDLKAQYTALQAQLDAAAQRALASGWYILGRECRAFEEEFAAYCGAVDCAGVNSGTDALSLALRACDIGPGDEVITVSHTAVATVAAIRNAGATPVLADIDPATFTLDVQDAAARVTPRTRAIIPVHLYGQAATMDEVLNLAQVHGLRVIEDCAQAHGAAYHGQIVGTLGDLGCFSFYPTKNLGALGDGGAVVSRDAELIERVRRLREYGWTPAERYVSQIEGTNSRLDEVQAALLRVKLPLLDEWNERRRALAERYDQLLPPVLIRPTEGTGNYHVYHLYVVRIPPEAGMSRDALRDALAEQGIATAIHYPVPVHRQPAYASLFGDLALPVTETIAAQILSLPLHPLLETRDIQRAAEALDKLLP